MMLLGFGVAFLVLLLVLLGQQHEQTALREWEAILNPEGAELYGHVSLQVHHENVRAQESYSAARRAYDQGRKAEAIRFLEIGGRVVGECSASLIYLLRNIWTLSRSAAAIAPVQPLRPVGFRTSELATLAGLHQLAHHLLITTRERLALRLAVLRCGVRAAAILLTRATRRTREHPESAPSWARIDLLRTDLGTLTDESLASLRVVLASLAAVRRPAAEGARKTA